MKIDEILGQEEQGKVIDELKKGRIVAEPDTETFKKQLDPLKHDVFNKALRPDKKVKVDPDDKNQEDATVVTSGDGETKTRIEKVARIAVALQKLIVKRAVAFAFGNPVTLDCTPEDDAETAVLKALKKVLFSNKEKSFNRKVARQLFSCTEVAELWYTVEQPTNAYGFSSKYKLRCALLSPLLGDTLYPYFDDSGDMAAFSREFTVTDRTGKKRTFFETYTEYMLYRWVQDGVNGWVLDEGYPKENPVGKIPVVYGCDTQVEWADVQILIDRLEKLLSNFADTNDYHASPKIVVKGDLKGFAKKGESGAILELEGDDASASYLAWQNAPESVKLEIETLLKLIYTISQTPDISFDSVKGLGAISGVALKLLFMDAHLKVADHQEVLDEYLQRRINVILAFISKLNVDLKGATESIQIEPVITPYMIVDKAAEIKIWQDANGGNPVMSQKASFSAAGLTSDTEADFEQYNSEQSSKNMFNIGEPTV